MPYRRSRRPVRLSSSRRQFLLGATATLSSVLLANCARTTIADSGANLESGSSSANVLTPTDTKTLYIYSWSSYIDDQLLKDFEAKTGIKAVADIYDSNEIMLAKMQAGGGNAYSIIYPSDYMVTEMIGAGMLTPIDASRLPVLEQLSDNWKSPVYDPNNVHSIPFAWGTTGLIYDPQKLGTEIKNMDYFWENQDDLVRQITLLNDVREVTGAMLKHLGYSYNSTNPEEIEAAFNQLKELKPSIAAFLTNGWEDQLASGDLAVSMAYSVDALALMDEHPNLTYQIPDQGTSLWTDTIVIPKTAPNVDAAYEWINFVTDQDNAVDLVTRLKFATPNQIAVDQLPTELKSNEKLFPAKQTLAKCEGIAPLPPEVLELYDSYWTQLTSG